MRTEIEEITPDIARELLKKNYDNRQIRHRAVEDFVKAIKRSDWKLTHQGIAIARSGRLIDGQHRLLAIIESGVAVRMNVSRDVEDDTFDSIDIGKTRGTADRIHLLDDAGENVTACSLIHKYLRFAVYKNNDIRPLSEFEKTFDEMRHAITLVAGAFRRKIRYLTRTDIGAALVVYINHDPVRGEQFLDAYLMCENLRRDSPVLRLRETVLLTQYKSSALGGAYWRGVRATQLHHEGQSATKLWVATEDWRGNQNSTEKTARRKKGEAAAKKRYVAVP